MASIRNAKARSIADQHYPSVYFPAEGFIPVCESLSLVAAFSHDLAMPHEPQLPPCFCFEQVNPCMADADRPPPTSDRMKSKPSVITNMVLE